ncbi:hypothetical protein [Sunxiuqinia elliptica]|uniref:hypothetical protein n=1 Tax=Sunxiuqinia elliptica TaxID=655355 RepID=UPI0014151EE3|nr:hypothetical protein [Sunxiuqinia elliptica]
METTCVPYALGEFSFLPDEATTYPCMIPAHQSTQSIQMIIPVKGIEASLLFSWTK